MTPGRAPSEGVSDAQLVHGPVDRDAAPRSVQLCAYRLTDTLCYACTRPATKTDKINLNQKIGKKSPHTAVSSRPTVFLPGSARHPSFASAKYDWGPQGVRTWGQTGGKSGVDIA